LDGPGGRSDQIFFQGPGQFVVFSQFFTVNLSFSVIDTYSKIYQHPQDRKKNDEQQIAEGFGRIPGIIYDPECYQ
jgi:hypothetical protein